MGPAIHQLASWCQTGVQMLRLARLASIGSSELTKGPSLPMPLPCHTAAADSNRIWPGNRLHARVAGVLFDCGCLGRICMSLTMREHAAAIMRRRNSELRPSTSERHSLKRLTTSLFAVPNTLAVLAKFARLSTLGSVGGSESAGPSASGTHRSSRSVSGSGRRQLHQNLPHDTSIPSTRRSWADVPTLLLAQRGSSRESQSESSGKAD